MPAVHHVLWTAGWDSTYRVCDLVLRYGRTVQPYYLHDPGRPSARTELAATATLRAAIIAKDPAAVDRLLPLVLHSVLEVQRDDAITVRLQRLRQRASLGDQYDWLARFAAQHQLDGLELSIHADDKAHLFLEDRVQLEGHGADRGYRLVRPPAEPDLALFERFRFPVFDLTKLQMAEYAATHGFGDVMEGTWFCHVPMLRRTPCGYCAPCVTTRAEGLGRRVPTPHLLRHLSYRVRRKSFEVAGRLRATRAL